MSDSRSDIDIEVEVVEVEEATEDENFRLIKRAVAAIAVVAVGELALGRRALIAFEAVRRAAKWAGDDRKHPKKGQVPSPQQAMEEALDDFLERSRRALALTKPKLEEMRRRTRESLSQPSIGALVSGGAAVAVVATIGLVPAAIGASTACLFRYYASVDDDDDETDARQVVALPAPTGSRA